jgi:peptidoglycan-associated lipoprotein
VQGNCDERGTTQYNVALGARRAEAAKKYLSDLGAAGSIDTVSYGEEKPLCTEATEACWAKNRRADFQIDR